MSVDASVSAKLSKCFSKLSICKSHSIGLNERPCFTPMRHLKMADVPYNDQIAALSCAYRDWMVSKILPLTPTSSSTWHSPAQGTLSNASLKSTKQQNSLPALPFNRVCQRPLNEDVVGHAELCPKSCLAMDIDRMLFSPCGNLILKNHCKQLSIHRSNCDASVVTHVSLS